MAKIKRNATVTITIEEAVDQYLLYCKNKNLSEVTLDTYTRHLKWLYIYMETKPVDTVTVEDLEDMLDRFNQEHQYGTRSENNFRRYINGFFKWLKRKGMIPQEIRLDYKKQDKKIQPVPTDGQMKRLLTKPNLNECTYNHYACYIVVNIIASTGLRVGAIANIKKQDIDFDNSVIHIKKAKNRKENIVTINRKLKLVLKEFLATVEADCEYLIEDRDGKKFGEGCLSMNVIRYCRNCGVECSAHCIRRWFAVSFMKQGGSIYTLSKLLHHSDIQTTQLYLASCNVETFSDEMAQYNPLDHLNNEMRRNNR
jgi:integrase/recombinase XerD